MIGQLIAHYRIIEKIGSGGMGEVYLAEDTKLERKVALKFLPRHLTEDREARARFEREAKAAAALNHPNIVTIHEIGEHEGQVFIAMEYVEGRTLKEIISEHPTPSALRPMPIPLVLDIASQLASGLAAAHEKGIVHRDVKPQNILVEKSGHVKILDFGLAKLKGVSSLTKESSTLGTVHYMSPEQTLGKEVDHRTDIWSLGVVLFEMLTGKLPFKGDYEQAVIYSILNEEPGCVTSIRNDTPPEFDRILEKALAKEPEDRYQHADDLLVDLKHMKRDSRPDRQPAPAARRREIRRWPRWAIPVVAILFVATASALFFVSREKPKTDVSKQKTDMRPVQLAGSHSIAVLPFKNLSDSREDEYFSDGITEDIIAQLSKIADLKVISRTSVMPYKNTTKNIRDIGKELDVGTVLEGSVRRAGNQVRIVAQLIDARNEGHLWAETYDKELIEIFAIQSDVSRQIASALETRISPAVKIRIDRKQTENTEAYQLYLKGRFHWNKRTAADLQKAIDYFDLAIEKDPTYAQAYACLASSYMLLSEYYVSSKETIQKAKTAVKYSLELDPGIAEARAVLGMIKFKHEWDWTGAEIEFRSAIELDPGFATAHQWYYSYLISVNRPEEALAEIKRAIELDPLSLVINVNLGDAYYFLREYDRAIDQLKKSVDLDPNFIHTYASLGQAFLEQGKYTEAIATFQKYQTLGGSKPDVLIVLGYAYALAGKRKDALKMLNELIEMYKQGNPVTFNIAWLYAGLGDKDNALLWLEKAYQEHDSQLFLIQIDPPWDDLRSDPRFISLLIKMGLRK